MVERSFLPGIGRVAFQTIRRIAATCVLLVIVRLMARNTIVLTRRIKERHKVRWRPMARRTFEQVMRADQGKAIGDFGMREISLAPILRVVAFQAGGREARPGMFLVVICLMAGQAIVFVGRLK